MKLDLDFVCPLTRSDMEGLATMGHCPQCDLDIPELSNLTAAEAQRVLTALECAHELGANLHFCGAFAQGADGHTEFVDPQNIPEDLPPEIASLFDERATFLLALSAVAALGFSLNSVLISTIYSPITHGADVFVLDGDGPRFLPKQAEADADALDAAQDAWVTINLANIRADLSSIFAPETTPEDLAEDAAITAARRKAALEFVENQREKEAQAKAFERDNAHARRRAERRAAQMAELERLGFTSEPINSIYQEARTHRSRRTRGKMKRRHKTAGIISTKNHDQ